MSTAATTADPVAEPPLHLDAVVERLSAGERTWAGTCLAERADLLDALADATAQQAEQWVRVATSVKQLDPGSPLVGEEWMSGPYAVVASCRALAETVRRLADGVDVLNGYAVRPAPGDRLAVRVLPHGVFDRILFSGFTADVWTERGVSEGQLRRDAGLAQRDPSATQGVALVLGAGNVLSIGPLDVIYQLYAEGRTAVLKLNPVTDPMLEVYRTVFAPFIERGLVEIVTGGAQVGGALAQHPAIAAVHMTGSESTHDAIVWGVGEEAVAARAAGMPALTKPITSELGGVSPVIVMPGPWSPADLRFQAEHVATMRLHNNGSNCIAAQILIVSADWDQKDAFLAAVDAALAGAPGRSAWYPGTADRVRAAIARHRGAMSLGDNANPRVVLPGLEAGDRDEAAFSTEYFGPVLGVTQLPGTGAAFLDAAVAEANARLRGTLGANLIAHPHTIAELGERFDEAVAALRYGTVAVNAWTGVGFATARATWGALPGHTVDDVQSGIGVVHNALLLADTERTVITGPFRPFPRSLKLGQWSLSPRPAWFVTNRTAAVTGRLLTAFAARPRWRALPGLVRSAMRG